MNIFITTWYNKNGDFSFIDEKCYRDYDLALNMAKMNQYTDFNHVNFEITSAEISQQTIIQHENNDKTNKEIKYGVLRNLSNNELERLFETYNADSINELIYKLTLEDIYFIREGVTA